MPKQREQENDGQRNADEPEQNASSKSHVSLLIVRNNKSLTNGRFQDLVRSLDAKAGANLPSLFYVSKDVVRNPTEVVSQLLIESWLLGGKKGV